MSERKMYVLHLRTACGAKQTRTYHELPEVFRVGLRFPIRYAHFPVGTSPWSGDKHRSFQLIEPIRGGDGEYEGGYYEETEY